MKVEMLLPTEFTKTKSIIGEYDEYERLYTNKLDKLNKMEKFLETHKLPKPTQEEMEYLKRIISNKDIVYQFSLFRINSKLSLTNKHKNISNFSPERKT